MTIFRVGTWRSQGWLGVLLLSAGMSFGADTNAEVTVPFDGSWKEQGFFRLFTNDYFQRGSQLDVVSDGTVSMLWRPVGEAFRNAKSASWVWRVSKGVPATNLTVKGMDDRNLAIYFVFVDPDREPALTGKSVRRLLREESARGLIYVRGGTQKTGSIFTSPYSLRLRTKVLRQAQMGQFLEMVDLEKDYRAAFGEDRGALVGLAISADSDDTNSEILASIGNLQLH